MKTKLLIILQLIFLTLLGNFTYALAGEAQAYATVTIIIPSKEEVQQMMAARGQTDPAQDEVRLAAAEFEQEYARN